MKLKNKGSGAVGELTAYDPDKGVFAVKVDGGDKYYYYSLQELNEEWTDA